MKAGAVKVGILVWPRSLRASDYLCPNDALEKAICRLEKQERTIATSLANKRRELAERHEAEAQAIARGDLEIIHP